MQQSMPTEIANPTQAVNLGDMPSYQEVGGSYGMSGM